MQKIQVTRSHAYSGRGCGDKIARKGNKVNTNIFKHKISVTYKVHAKAISNNLVEECLQRSGRNALLKE